MRTVVGSIEGIVEGEVEVGLDFLLLRHLNTSLSINSLLGESSNLVQCAGTAVLE